MTADRIRRFSLAMDTRSWPGIDGPGERLRAHAYLSLALGALILGRPDHAHTRLASARAVAKSGTLRL